MKPVTRRNRVALLLGAVSFALLASCTDTHDPTTPNAVDISSARSIMATVTTSVESFNGKGGPGPIAPHRYTAKVTGFRNGGAYTMVPPTDPIYCGGPCDPVSDMAPVLYIAYGQLMDNYDESGYDSNGNLIHFIATGPGNQPITDVWTWVNGVPQVHMHNTWQAVSGGFKLVNQTITVVRPDASRAVTLSTTVSAGYTMVSANSVGARLAGFAENALSRIGCWLGPQVAYANIPAGCGMQVLVFAGETFGLGVGTVSLFGVSAAAPPVTPLAASAYLAQWGLWTRSLYDMLKCIDDARGRPHRTITLPNVYGF